MKYIHRIAGFKARFWGYFLLGCAVFLPFKNAAQLPVVQPKDTVEIKIWLDTLKKNLVRADYQRVSHISNEIQRASRVLHYPTGELQAAQLLAQFLIIRGQFDAADSLLNAILPIAQQHQLLGVEGAIWNNIAIVRQNTGRVQAATNAYLASADAFDRAGNKALKAAVLGNLGATFLKFGDYERSRPYLQTAAELNLALGDSVKYAYALLNLAVGHYRSQHFPEANAALSTVEAISHNHPEDIELRFGLLSNWGEWYFRQKDWKTALEWHQKALELAEKIQSADKTALQLQNVAQCYAQLGQTTEANRWMDRALEQALLLKEKNRLLELYQAAADIKAANQQWEQAYILQKKYQLVKEEVQNEKVQRTVTELEMNYQNEQKSRQLAEQSLQLARRDTERAVLLGLLIIVLLGASLLVLFFRNKQRQQQVALLEAVVRGEERERNRLARELHDGLGGLLAGATLQLNAAAGSPSGLALLNEAQTEIRRMAHNLLPESILKNGLVAALNTYCQQWNQPENGRLVQFIALAEPTVSPNLATALFRMTQELITNAVRHGKATEILVQLGTHAGQITLTVEDNGVGFAPKTAGSGLGLLNIGQRIQALRGRCDVQSQPNQGTSVHLEIPIV